METQICYPVIMANKSDNTSCIFYFPYLYALIAWPTRQIVSNYFVFLRGSSFRVTFLFLVIVYCIALFSDRALRLFSSHLQIQLHLLYTFFGCHSSVYSRSRIITVLCGPSCALSTCRSRRLICFFISSIPISTLIILVIATSSCHSIIVVCIFNCLVGFGRSPHDAVDNVFVLVENLYYGVVRVIHSAASSLCALLFY